MVSSKQTFLPSLIICCSLISDDCRAFVPDPITFRTRPQHHTRETRRFLSHWESEFDEPYRNQLDSFPLQPIPETKLRRDRKRREEELVNFYVTGNELQELRSHVAGLRLHFESAARDENTERATKIREAIHRAESQDAEHVYYEAREVMRLAELDGREEDYESSKVLAMEARTCLPQFNLDGLWVGKYGSHGYELINVTYSGDTLVAYKVTGDKNVPKGEITFTADLKPTTEGSEGSLEPIELSDSAASQWGVKHLTRFPGHGQVSSEGFRNRQWMNGQLLIVGDYFSFAWVPIGHQIFFGRPSPELTLRMLRENEAMTDLERMRSSALKMLEETKILEEDEKVECDVPFYTSGGVFDGFEKGCFE